MVISNYSKVVILVVILGILLDKSHCLYEDQIGKFDWRQQYIGRVLFVQPRVKAGTLILATDKNAIASIRMRDGSLIWRQILPDSCTLNSLSIIETSKIEDSPIETICTNGDSFIWNPYNGLISTIKESKSKKRTEADSGRPLDSVWNTHDRPNSIYNSQLVNKAFIVSYEDTKTNKDRPSQVLLLKNDDELSLWDSQGRQLWSRQEALASIVASEFIELPLSREDSEIEIGLKTKDGLMDQFSKRIFTQINQIQSLIAKGPQGIIDVIARASNKAQKFALKDAQSVLVDRHNLNRDVFGLRKLILALSDNGKLFGIDTLTGSVIWQIYDADFSTVGRNSKTSLISTREAHYSNEGQGALVHPDGHLMTFNPILGIVTEKLKFPNIKQISIFDQDSVEDSRGIIILDENNKVHIHPKAYVDKFQSKHHMHFMTVIEKNRTRLVGYKFVFNQENKSISSKVTWTFPMPAGDVVEDVAFKRPQEVIHSPARVLGDRNILYKYANPNLIAIISRGGDDSSCNPETHTNIYLVDGVTGSLVYSVNHPKTRGPTCMVHSENWLVYSYYNSKVRRMEISSLELFEGSTQSNETTFSSLARSSLRPKLVEHKSFIFPGGIGSMRDTVTKRGMTNKNIIMALHTGALLELPRMFLDPRRPINILPEHREEGLIPYMPEIPILSEGTINYNQSVFGIRNIQTSGASLESTCLVFASGLDLYFTRVTPSKTFDILKDDFDHLLISAVLTFLVVASVVSKRLAQQKALNNAWK